MLIAMSLSLLSCNNKKTVFPDYMYEEDDEVMDEYSLKDVNNFKSEKEDINKAFKDNYVDDANLINKDNITYGELFLANKRCDNLAYISNNEEDAHYIFYANNKASLPQIGKFIQIDRVYRAERYRGRVDFG